MSFPILEQVAAAPSVLDRMTPDELINQIRMRSVSACELEDHIAAAYTMFNAIAMLAADSAPEAAELARLGADQLSAFRPESAA